MDYFNEFGRAETLLDLGPAIADAPVEHARPKVSAQLALSSPGSKRVDVLVLRPNRVTRVLLPPTNGGRVPPVTTVTQATL